MDKKNRIIEEMARGLFSMDFVLKEMIEEIEETIAEKEKINSD